MSAPLESRLTNRAGCTYSKWICDSGHHHPSHRHAVACNVRLRKWQEDRAVKAAAR